MTTRITKTPRTASIGAPALTLIMLGVTAYLLFAEAGWRSGPRLLLFSCVCLFVAVALAYAAGLARRGLHEAATVLLWGMFVASAYFVMFAGALG